MVIDRRQVDARRAGDLPHRGAVVALLREQLLGGFENDLARRSGFQFVHGALIHTFV